MSRFDRVLMSPWALDLVVLVVSAGVLLTALIMVPDADVLTIFGVDVPVLCGFRRVTGYGCPGCGMTRSFAFMMAGQPIQAFHMNYLGPLLFVGFASQVPYRLWVLAKAMRWSAA